MFLNKNQYSSGSCCKAAEIIWVFNTFSVATIYLSPQVAVKRHLISAVFSGKGKE